MLQAMLLPAEVHEALEPISWLAGRWYTEAGRGCFPNLSDFDYYEELEFTCVGQPMFNYSSMSMHPEKRIPMHQERGFMRINPDTNEVAFIISHNFGLTSLEEGYVDPKAKEVKLQTVNITRMSFTRPPYVKSFKREMKLLAPDVLEIILLLETENTPMSEHLKAVYRKRKVNV